MKQLQATLDIGLDEESSNPVHEVLQLNIIGQGFERPAKCHELSQMETLVARVDF